MKTAINATHQLQNAMLCHTQLASQRNEMLLLEILTPAQTALFLEWMRTNKARCMALVRHRCSITRAAQGEVEQARCESTLNGVFQQLEDLKLENN